MVVTSVEGMNGVVVGNVVDDLIVDAVMAVVIAAVVVTAERRKWKYDCLLSISGTPYQHQRHPLNERSCSSLNSTHFMA